MSLLSRGPTRRRLVSFALAGLLICALLGWLRWRNREPAYEGKTLTNWLYDKDLTEWPNDVYGHIHNELWEALVAGGYAADHGSTNSGFVSGVDERVDTAVLAVRRIGTNAIPRLLELLSSRPGFQERCSELIRRTIPRLGPFLERHKFYQTSEARRLAAWKGFAALGTNGEVALPALENLLHRPEADFRLASTIAEIGPRGIQVLVTSLTDEDNHTVDNAAFALGMTGAAARTSAAPVLVKLVENGRASYQVLGAIGRLGGYPDLVIPALSAYLGGTNGPPEASFGQEMAILILALYGEHSISAVPVLLKLYEYPDKTSRQLIRVALKHIDPKHVQELVGRPPSVRDDRDPWWEGPVD
jgi:hypothetical protein